MQFLELTILTLNLHVGVVAGMWCGEPQKIGGGWRLLEWYAISWTSGIKGFVDDREPRTRSLVYKSSVINSYTGVLTMPRVHFILSGFDSFRLSPFPPEHRIWTDYSTTCAFISFWFISRRRDAASFILLQVGTANKLTLPKIQTFSTK